MGIQDRDYWHERQREQEGLPPRREPSFEEPKRRIRILDEVRAPARLKSRSLDNFFKVILLFAAFFVLALLGYRWYVTTLVKDAIGIATGAVEQMTANQAQISARINAQAAEQRKKQEAEKLLLIQKANEERALQLRLQVEHDERVRKREAAFKRFYQPSQACMNEASVECANAFIRAQRAFNEQYKD
ncbi:hypothetical protein [Comamonas sp. NoAH]|uniref:hypothetical protein n=1 Tax=Comamonas halotolerans TaxID=3041496 RepID=UPI0024E17350|nr:hypothetical protein [Comamonas sp. NoAH]